MVPQSQILKQPDLIKSKVKGDLSERGNILLSEQKLKGRS